MSDIKGTEMVRCCVVGGGPAGIMLAYLLARQGVSVILLESHKDFDREFRGDTLHPSALEILDDLGLADRLLEIPHSKIRSGTFRTPSGPLILADFHGMKSRFPYITLIRQDRFLEFMATEAEKYSTFSRKMGANVKELIEEGGTVRGVCYQAQDGWYEVRADLTVAADGRFSRLRELAGLVPVKTAAPMDVLWFRLPHSDADSGEEELTASIKNGHMLIRFDRLDYWQVGYVIAKGGFHDLKTKGIEPFRESLVDLMPELADRVATIKDWSQISPLAVESSCLSRWSKPGLLLIGDAAHVMSPVGGVGINYAIQDAVTAANDFATPLREGRIGRVDLESVRRRRWWPTRIAQAFQSQIQNRIISPALDSGKPFRPPFFMRLPFFKRLAARFIGYGVWPMRVKLKEEIRPRSV